jgi:hypothetical protein
MLTLPIVGYIILNDVVYIIIVRFAPYYLKKRVRV